MDHGNIMEIILKMEQRDIWETIQIKEPKNIIKKLNITKNGDIMKSGIMFQRMQVLEIKKD
jgi:hypothetical protein